MSNTRCPVTYNPDNPVCLDCGENEATIANYRYCQNLHAHKFLSQGEAQKTNHTTNPNPSLDEPEEDDLED